MPRHRRPADSYEVGSRVPLNVRTTRERRQQLEAAADESGRSLLAELEYRLDQSFAVEDRFAPRTVKIFGDLARSVAGFYGDSWLDDPRRYAMVRERVIDWLRPVSPASYVPDPGYYVDNALREFVATGDRMWLTIARQVCDTADLKRELLWPSVRGMLNYADLSPERRAQREADIAAAEALIPED